MSTARRIAANSVYQLIGKFITLGLSLVMVAVMARKLGVSSYGVYTVAIAYSQLFAIVCDFGIGTYLLKQLSRHEESSDTLPWLLGSAIGARVFTSVALAIVACGLTYFLPYDSLQRQVIAIAMAAVVLQMLNGTLITVLQAKLEMRYAATSEVIGRVITFLFVMLALYTNRGLIGVITAQLVGNMANVLASYLFSKRFIAPRYKVDFRQYRSILFASLLLGISSILSYIYFKTDTFLLSILSIPGRANTVEVGIYGAAYKLIDILIIIPGVFLGSVFPLFTGFLAKSEQDRAREIMARATQVMGLAGVAMLVVIQLFSQEIISLVAGENFSDAAVPLSILAFAVPFNFISSAFSYALLGLEKQKQLTYLYGLAAIANILFNLLYIPTYSYLAAAWVTVGTEVFVSLGGAWLLWRSFRIPIHLTETMIQVGLLLGVGCLLLWLNLPFVSELLVILVTFGIFGYVFSRSVLARHESEYSHG